MLIKTPVRFVEGATTELEDADGQTILSLDTYCRLNQATLQAIVDAFEDAARWQFMARAVVPGSPEGEDLTTLSFGEPEQMPTNAEALVRIVDLARSRLATT